MALLKAAVVVVALVGVSRLLAPRLLSWVDASRSREVFLLAILGLCIGTAWLTSLVGLSLALGAFLGGMVVADTEYGHRAMSDILPLRHAFVSIFFRGAGDVVRRGCAAGAAGGWCWVLLAGLLLGKGAVATLAALVMRFPARAAWLAGVGLAQFGEFGFVLIKLAQSNGLIEAADARPLLTAGILSMFLTPLLVRAAPHVTAGERLLAPLERIFGVKGVDALGEEGEALSGHVILVGFGVGGALAATALQGCAGGLVALEMNLENVRRGRAQGLPVYYGDATSEEALEHAQIKKARLMVLLVNDPEASRRIVDTARRLSPGTPILMRTTVLVRARGAAGAGRPGRRRGGGRGGRGGRRPDAARAGAAAEPDRGAPPRAAPGDADDGAPPDAPPAAAWGGRWGAGDEDRDVSGRSRRGGVRRDPARAVIAAAHRRAGHRRSPRRGDDRAPGSRLFCWRRAISSSSWGAWRPSAAALALLGEPAQKKSDATL
jgi:hypothetical protein